MEERIIHVTEDGIPFYEGECDENGVPYVCEICEYEERF